MNNLITVLPIEELHRHSKARALNDDVLAALADSIDQVGLINPIRVRQAGYGYEIMRERLWKRVQEHAGPPPKDMPKRPATQWVKPGIKARVKHLRGEEDLRHASLQDFWDED
ncbi:ParB N-terminal domain-containing protein [Mesorhizobium onobrychidis]|uniref:ParB N-terminal domain-containing protein n=1 Tax=Mesorhizobium onobrychidis TaxID=2775404 RepID=UPI002157C34D|nr:ParB N-terminal domain-containing protein [Mesorhizobium onobrychidis]